MTLDSIRGRLARLLDAVAARGPGGRAATATLLALTAGLLAAWHLRRQEAALRHRLDAVALVVAARDLGTSTPLDAADVRIGSVPRESLPGGALVPEAVPALVGRRLAAPLRSGDPVLLTLVADGDGPARPLAHDLHDGRRAVAVPIEPAAAVAGFLEPGDLVDVLLVWQDGPGATRAATLLEAMRLLAVGERRRPGHAPADAATAVLDAAPAEAEVLHLALERGRLALVLRAPGDRAPRADRRIAALAPFLPGARSAAAPTPAIEVIHGAR